MEVTRIVEIEVTRVSLVEVVVTATPSPSPTPERPLEELPDDLAREISSDLELLDAVKRVTLVRLDTGLLEIELLTTHRAREAQPQVSWLVVNIMAGAFAGTTPQARRDVMGSEDVVVRLTTYSAEGEHGYRSTTDYATMVKLDSRSISYDEWVRLAHAGFQ